MQCWRLVDQAITCASVGIRVALEQENKELRRLAVACDKRIIESEVCTCMCAISPSVRPAPPPSSSIYTYMTRSYMTLINTVDHNTHTHTHAGSQRAAASGNGKHQGQHAGSQTERKRERETCTYIHNGTQVSVVRANEEATLRINQLQMQLAQAQSEAATAADISAEHSRAKLMLGSEIDSLRAENADLKSKLDGAARSAEAEVLALVRENQELTRTLALEQRDMKELERVRADLNEERKKVEGSMLELEHARRQAEDEASYLHEQLRVKTAELGQSREDLSHAARRADMKETQMSTDFESRLKHMAAARDEAAMAAREAREREYAAKNALEQQSVRATQEADLLRRDLSRLQMVAAGAEAAGEESAGLRRQVREITQALDETRAQVDALRVINEGLTARNSSLEATNAGLQGAHTAMAKEKIDRGRQLQEVEGQAKASAARAAASEQQVMNLKKELNAVHAEMHARARGDAAEVQTGSSVGGGGAGGVATLQQQVQTLCQDREVAIATGEKMAQKLREFEEENTRLNEEFRAVTADAQAAKAQVAMLQAMQRAAFSSNHANTEAVDAAKSNTPMTAIRHQQLVSITTPPPQTKVPDRQGAREEEALAVTRRLLDLERGTGKLLRERNGHLETQVDDQEKHIKSLNSQLVHAQHELGAKQAEVDEVRAISAAWMAAKPTTKERQDGDKEGGVGKQMREASFGAASERQVLGRLFRGCQVGITPACITLHFSGRGTQDAAGHDDKNSGGAVVEAECGRDATWVGGDVLEVMCNLLTESLGVPAETLVPIFVEKVGESSAGGFVVGVLALCSNHLLQAHGLYQVAEAETPAGIAQRLCTSVSSLPLSPLLSDTRVVGKLGTLDRVDASVVMSRGASDLSQELDENKMLDVIARMEAERDVREQELTKLRNLATSLSRRLADHTQDGGFGEEELMIPRDKLEEVLQDAQERVDEAEARAEQLAVQLLLLQHADARLKAPGEDIADSFVRGPPQDECVNGEVQETRRAGMNGDDDVAELWEVNRNLSQHPHSHVSDEPGVLASDVRTQRENLDALWDGAHGDRRGGEVYEHEPEDLMHEGDHQMENDLPEGAEDELWGTDDAPLQSEQGSKQIWGARVP